jgi:hypothetical protein
MIAFGVAITDGEQYSRFAEPGIKRAAEADSVLMPHQATGSIFRSYNILLDQAKKRGDLEALVLVHQDAEIVDSEFVPKLREALKTPDVGVVGCVGAVGVRSIAWWEGAVTWASFTHRYEEMGGGELPALSWKNDEKAPFAQTGEVDTIDGFVMCFSPWAIENIRFDESLGTKLHGYDFDYCLQVREAGKKVVTADFKVIHNHSLELVSDPETWVEAHIKIAEKWEGRMLNAADGGTNWEARARRAEAEAAVARTQAVAAMLQGDAKALYWERALDEWKASIGWKLTEPLRKANKLRRDMREKRTANGHSRIPRS